MSHFFAHLSRLTLIHRWPLMRNVRIENVSEHSLQVAFIAHALAVIKNRKFDGKLNAERVALLAMYHDASEIITGDLPTTIKYYNQQIAHEYKKIENIAQQTLIEMLPKELQDDFRYLLDECYCSKDEKQLVKQADDLSAYLKCLEELSAGNKEFAPAKARLEKKLLKEPSSELTYFMQNFVPSFSMSLQEMSLNSHHKSSKNVSSNCPNADLSNSAND
ncbi:5'-deoxynucleotidase [Candidatus Fukatsuia symbiotica]|uniref:5'-deoxynucleotidase n=1 Tax=Candidatus Fukatsuia symbiotica TaxID=1878942 RepID=A0A2U8I7T7_9GAMM|nr:5'-deoxynucleotidase [Candidatus Fukatsuia symbiotica]